MRRRRTIGRRASLAAAAVVLAAVAVRAAPVAAGAAPRGQSGVPPVTLLYQNFPNPFPTAGTPYTCLWFDLHRTSRARLTIHGIRGNLVRTIMPDADLAGDLPAGRYGRAGDGPGGCDPRFTWDGRADDGRLVRPGLYLVRLRTETHESFRKILFRGQ